MGIVVLHHPGVAGRPLTVTSPWGAQRTTTFPERISAHQPALDIQKLHWTTDDLTGSLAFDGGVFEMEDQRNWTDASFKTYSTPLSRPFPVLMHAGEVVRQSVVLTCDRRPHPDDDVLAEEPLTRFRIDPDDAAVTAFPEVAIGASTNPENTSRATGPDPNGPVAAALLVELDLHAANWRAALDRAAMEAGRAPLDVRFITSDPDLIPAAVHALARYQVTRVGVFDTRTHMSETVLSSALRAELMTGGLTAEPVAGTRAHYTELNRNSGRLHIGDNEHAAVTFSITPQMHDRSRQQVIESISMQRLVAEQAARLAPKARIHIGPITLRPRFNAVPTSPPAPDSSPDTTRGYGPEFVPDANDPRQSSTAAAAWLISSATALCVPGVTTLTYFEAVGPRGFRPRAGSATAFPAAEALQWLRGIAGAQVLSASATRNGPTILAVRNSGLVTVLAANLEPLPRAVHLDVPKPWTTAGWTQIGEPQPEPVMTPRTVSFTIPPASAIRWQGRF
jgi:hypothetical protein